MYNLQIAFPEKTKQERVRIAKNFYHNFVDSMIESVKLLSASDRFFENRFTGNWDLVDRFYDTGKSVQLHLGHNFNWEWGNVIVQKKVRYQMLGVYRSISNKSFNRMFQKIRSRTGVKLLNARNMAKEFLPYRGSQYCLALIADQSPAGKQKTLWFDFFNRKTAFLANPAKNAIKNNTIVLFAFIAKPKRGYYNVTFSLVEETPQNTTEEMLTQKYVRYLEDVIRRNPSMWLWSHRRWRREWKGETVVGKN
jgi:KDO2-lipid IV(A) lauroyltransferase